MQPPKPGLGASAALGDGGLSAATVSHGGAEQRWVLPRLQSRANRVAMSERAGRQKGGIKVLHGGLLRWVDKSAQCAPGRIARQDHGKGVSQPIHKHADMLPVMNGLKVLHADASVVVVDKPAGVLSVPGLGAGEHDNLTTLVQTLFADARVVHRLDQATSGLMLFARGAAMQRALSMAFEARQVGKRYVAVVAGRISCAEGSIAAPLIADWPQRPRQKVDPERGKPALTHWRLLEHAADTSRLELQPITGRSHQLRVHLLSIGHPILGDMLYAPEPQRSARLLLHATQLALMHPFTGAPCSYDCPAPF